MKRQDAERELSRFPYHALRAVWEAQEERLIPPPSLLSLNGRGIWLFYLLVDPGTGLPPKAYIGLRLTRR